MTRKITQEEFVASATEIHSGRYDYSATLYVNARAPVLIVCPVHGEFRQDPWKHLNGSGCARCSAKKLGTTRNKSAGERYLSDLRDIHEDRYDKYPYGRPRALDLFCCAGGASMGLHRAGFDVVGVDIEPQRHYPFEFHQADALTFPLDGFDFIWASPPCQRFSDLAKRNGNAHEWPDLIGPIRARVRRWATYGNHPSGGFYVIENVDGAPMLHPVVLCGTMFPPLRVLRHRLFEANFCIEPPPHGNHPKCHTFDKRKSHYGKTDGWRDFVQVTGGGNCTLAQARDAMGIDWMTKSEINEAIPPAYAEYIGRAALAHMASMRVNEVDR